MSGDGGWHEVRRRGRTSRQTTYDERPNSIITSFYVSGLPWDANRKELWKACSKLGKLEDIYLARRRDATGAYFGFLRYSDVGDMEIMENDLNKIMCRGKTLKANVARKPRLTVGTHKRPTIPPPHRQAPPIHRVHPRDSRSYADITRGDKQRETQIEPPACINLKPVIEIRNWADKSTLIGEVRNLDILCNFNPILGMEGYDILGSKYLGGIRVILKFKSNRATEVFRANKTIWQKWFNRVDQVGRTNGQFDRLTWIKMVGMPLHAWDDNSFATVAARFGKVMANDNPFWNNDDLSFGKACILTSSLKRLNEEVSIEVDSAIYRVGVSDLTPQNLAIFKTFKKFTKLVPNGYYKTCF
ncbi:hypothetical protein LXL04_000332 [Taraxacum kok-saghyz]